MHVFVTGVTGYIGGTVAMRLLADGHSVSGLCRSQDKARELEKHGIRPVLGSLTDLALIHDSAKKADAVINAASAEDAVVAQLLVDALENSNKPLLHTSGTSVVADRKFGEATDVIFSEDMPFDPPPERTLRVAVEKIILSGARRGMRSIVIRPSLVYGKGSGLNPDSHQLPHLIHLAVKEGRPVHGGRGLNIWSNVHIDDLADLYACAVSQAPPASVFFAENGEASWKDMALAIGKQLSMTGLPKELGREEALTTLGVFAITSFASNSRVSSEKARRMLGWKASSNSIWEEMSAECERNKSGHH
jgi:nucleoside-diphosphate-sugar epimerase